MNQFSVSGTEWVPANIDLRRGSVFRYPQHRELPRLPSGMFKFIIKPIKLLSHYDRKIYISSLYAYI